MEQAISVRSLTKDYGNFRAVRGIDFQVRPGEIFGLLGPNGAGKTTTVEILEGLRPRSSGEVEVLGFDPAVQSRKLKNRIGVCLQATNLPEKIRVIEAIQLFASFYSAARPAADLLQKLQLESKERAYYSELSGGQKQRVALALALLNDPQLLFLDEPTAGLDPQARHEIHRLISELKREQRTVLLTTHYIEEAEKLCDRVAIIDAGKIIATGSPREIQEEILGESVIEVACREVLPDRLPESRHCSRSVAASKHRLLVFSEEPARALVDVVKWVDQQGLTLTDANLKRPTLEEVFIELTGRSLRE